MGFAFFAARQRAVGGGEIDDLVVVVADDGADALFAASIIRNEFHLFLLREWVDGYGGRFICH